MRYEYLITANYKQDQDQFAQKLKRNISNMLHIITDIFDKFKIDFVYNLIIVNNVVELEKKLNSAEYFKDLNLKHFLSHRTQKINKRKMYGIRSAQFCYKVYKLFRLLLFF